MKLITTATELENEFRRLTKQYNQYFWATAWASSGTKLFNDLISQKDKIRKIVVGIHFYQTHPNFIEAFLNNKNVRFIQQPEGTFHPKVYIFCNNKNEWEMIIGSANFTTEAFSRNTEASLLISDKDSNFTNTYQNAINLIEQSFSKGKVFNKSNLNKYRIIWKNHRRKIKSLSGQYGSIEGNSKPIHEIPIMSRNWEEFMKEVRNDPTHKLERRLRVIEIAQALFRSVNHYYELTEDQRKFIAGIPNKLNIDGAEDWAYFGSMKGAGLFKNKIKSNDVNISKALDQIPHYGQITKQHYDYFIKYFTQTFSGNYIATATRLLCMKRPDTFICFDSKNRSKLCKDFGILQSEMNYERYWEDIIERVYDSDWWLNPNPKSEIEEKVSNARAAFLDSLYYKHL